MNDLSERLTRLQRLSPREREVLILKCEGHTHAEIAARLVIALPTVKSHIARVYEKLELDALSGVRRHVELSRYGEALQGGALLGATPAGPDLDGPAPADERRLLPVLEDEISLLEERTRALQAPAPQSPRFMPDPRRRFNRGRLAVPLIMVACSLVGGLLGAGLMWAAIRPALRAPMAAPGPTAAGSAVSAAPSGSALAPAGGQPPAQEVCGQRERVKVDTPPFVRTQGLTAYSPASTGNAVLSQRVRAVVVDKRGVWGGFFATEQGGRGGVGQFNRTGWVDCRLPGEGAAANVNALAVDAAGNLWVGAEKGGVKVWTGAGWRVYGMEDGLPSNEIFGLTIDREGAVWAATWEGVAKLDGERWTVPYSVETHTIFSDRVHALAFDSAGSIWVGHIDRGVSQYRAADGKWVHHESGPHSIGGNQVRSSVVRPAADGRPESVWFATADGGVSKFENGRWTVYRAVDGLPSDDANAVAVDKYGRVWAATGAGVAFFDGSRWITYNTLPSLSIAFGPACTDCPYTDEHVWTGSEALGLTVSRLPYPGRALDVVRVAYFDAEGNELAQPVVLAPGQKFRPEITVRPRQPYQLSEKRGDMLVHVDEDPALRFGAYEHMAVEGVVAPGQPYVFTDYENRFVAPPLGPGERERAFVSRWRVWMHSRYGSEPIEIAFTVAAEGLSQHQDTKARGH